MPDIITLSCPTCGAKLSISQDIERFACSQCGQEYVVKRAGGMVALVPVQDSINPAGSGLDKAAAELTIIQLKKEIEELTAERDKIASRHHRPKINFLGIALVVLGGLVGFSAIRAYSMGSDGSVLAVIGFFLLFLGLFSLSSASRN